MTRSRLSKSYQKLINLSRCTLRICKSQQQECLKCIEKLFQSRNNDYNLRQFSQFELPNVRRVLCGTESISFLGPKIWNIVPNEFKKETSLHAFKKLIKKWEPENCRCRLCKSHDQNVCFIQDSVFFQSSFVCMYVAFVIVIYFSILVSLFG